MAKRFADVHVASLPPRPPAWPQVRNRDADSMAKQGADGAEVLPQSRRPDGTLRPEVRVRKGYVPPEEQQTYDRWKTPAAERGVVPGSDGPAEGVPKAMSKTAAKNAKRNAKRREELAQQAAQEQQRPPHGEGDASAAEAAEPSAQAAGKALRKKAASEASSPDAGSGGAAPSESSEVEKKLKALKKRLRQIDDLVEKQANGATLNSDQRAKVKSRDVVAADLARWETLGDVDILKKVKGLKKKARQIDELQQRADAGEELNDDQRGKLKMRAQLTEEVAMLEAMIERL